MLLWEVAVPVLSLPREDREIFSTSSFAFNIFLARVFRFLIAILVLVSGSDTFNKKKNGKRKLFLFCF